MCAWTVYLFVCCCTLSFVDANWDYGNNYHSNRDCGHKDYSQKEECESDLKMTATGYKFQWNQNSLTKFVHNNDFSWFLRINDTEAKFSKEYGVKCQTGCQHCNASCRPEPPIDITYRSTNGSNLCFEWKEHPSTNYTMYYKMPAYFSVNDFKYYKPCMNTIRNSTVAKCCPDDLRPTGMIGVRIDYENEYIKVYGIKYILRARTIVIPNPVKSITLERLDDMTYRLNFEDPDDWNSYSFSPILDKRICQISPRVNGHKCKIAKSLRKNQWDMGNLNHDTNYTFTVETGYIENRWSEPKYITFQTNTKIGIKTTMPTDRQTSKDEVGDGDGVQEVCESDLQMTATGYQFKWNLSPVTKIVQHEDVTWHHKLRDSEAQVSQKYGIKCQSGCHHCHNKKNRPEPPRNIAYKSTNGSDLCFEWKERPSTNYTMFYKMPAFMSVNDFQNYKPCTNTIRDSGVAKCCPDDLQPTGIVGVRIDYENEYIKVYGIKYILRARTIVIPNPVKSITYKRLNDTAFKINFEDPEDWNSYSFGSVLDKQICEKSPPVKGDKCMIYNKNEIIISGLDLDKKYIFTVQCGYIEGRWSKKTKFNISNTMKRERKDEYSIEEALPI